MDKEVVVHIYNGILLSHKKNKIPFAATLMDLEITISSEACQTEKDKYHMISHMRNLKSETNELMYRKKQIYRHRKQINGYQRG